MEFQKITNFLDTTSDDKDLPRFVTKKWIEVYDQSEKKCNPNKEIRIKKSMLKSDLCDCSDAYIAVKGDITLEGDDDTNKRNKNLIFENNAPFIYCISKINGVKIDKAEDLDVVMPMYNLPEYSKNKKQQVVYGVIIEMNQVILFLLILDIFKYRTNIVGKTTENNASLTTVKLVIPLKCFK